MGDTCTPSCGCRATSEREAIERTARFIGVDPDKASALIYLLNDYGWTLTRRDPR